MEFKKLESLILEYLYEREILKKNSNQKKKDDIVDSIISAVIRSEISFDDFILFINDARYDKVINLDFFKFGGNVDNYINPKWLKFAKCLWSKRPVGLGTPNAACGEAELMFIFLSPKIKKGKKGDLLINGEIFELKGEDIRVSGKISGKSFRNRTLDICNKYGLRPNISKKTNKEAVEIEKPKHEKHWINELSKLSKENKIAFISEFLSCIDANDLNTSFLFNNDVLDFKALRKTIVKILYKSIVDENSFDKFVMLGDGSNAKIYGRDLDKFNEDVDNGVIEINSDYFRINQNTMIGWYIS